MFWWPIRIRKPPKSLEKLFLIKGDSRAISTNLRENKVVNAFVIALHGLQYSEHYKIDKGIHIRYFKPD